jgi:6-phosphogluconolactonase (cycloisomerase 2 family)
VLLAAFVVSISGAIALACGSDSSTNGGGGDGADGASGEGGASSADASGQGAGDSSAGDSGTMSGGEGGMDGAVGSFGKVFMYAGSDSTLGGASAVHGYVWDQTSGYLTEIDMDPATPGVQPFSAPKYPIALAAHPNGKWLYAVTFTEAAVLAFSIDPATGRLTQIEAAAPDGGAADGSAQDAGPDDFVLPTNASPVFAAMDPKGRCLYVADQSFGLRALTIDSTTGALTLARTETAAQISQWIAVDPQARFLVVAGTGYQVSIHRLDATTGLPLSVDGGMGPGKTYATPLNSWTVSLDPTGSFAYVPNLYIQKMNGFTIDPITLDMQPIPVADAGNEPYLALAHPSQPLLYTAGYASNMGVYSIGDGGVLTAIATDAGVYSPGYPLSIDPSQAHLYVGGFQAPNTISLVDVNGPLLAARGPAQDAGSYLSTRTFVWVRP